MGLHFSSAPPSLVSLSSWLLPLGRSPYPCTPPRSLGPRHLTRALGTERVRERMNELPMGEGDTARCALKPECVFGLSFFPSITGSLTTAFPGQGEVCLFTHGSDVQLVRKPDKYHKGSLDSENKSGSWGNAASWAVNDAHCGFTAPPTLSDPLFSRSGRGCCLAGWRERWGAQ